VEAEGDQLSTHWADPEHLGPSSTPAPQFTNASADLQGAFLSTSLAPTVFQIATCRRHYARTAVDQLGPVSISPNRVWIETMPPLSPCIQLVLMSRFGLILIAIYALILLGPCRKHHHSITLWFAGPCSPCTLNSPFFQLSATGWY